MSLYLVAAKSDVPEAMHNIGFLYQHGKGVKADLSKAIEWYTKAADLNYGVSQFDLGFMYEHGMGTKIDNKKAASLYKKAADNRIPEGLFQLGFFYYHGKSVSVDYFKSYAYIKAASILGLKEADENLIWPRKKLTPKQLEQAKNLAASLAGK